jgi:hypothetical protein
MLVFVLSEAEVFNPSRGKTQKPQILTTNDKTQGLATLKTPIKNLNTSMHSMIIQSNTTHQFLVQRYYIAYPFSITISDISMIQSNGTC